ncbi:MAG TPA: hypothetical protein PL064_08195, partial [Thermogutta sp.]|nr:hypothetical protein [Thermogutta sp.]
PKNATREEYDVRDVGRQRGHCGNFRKPKTAQDIFRLEGITLDRPFMLPFRAGSRRGAVNGERHSARSHCR